MKFSKKILIGLGVVALTAGSLIGSPAKAQACDITCELELTQRALDRTAAVPAQAQNVNYDKLAKTAAWSAVGMCLAKQGKPALFNTLKGKYSEFDIDLAAASYTGLGTFKSQGEAAIKAYFSNKSKFESQLDSNCRYGNAKLTFVQPSAPAPAQVEYRGNYVTDRDVANRQACVDQLSANYTVYTRGMLKNCIHRRREQDYINGR